MGQDKRPLIKARCTDYLASLERTAADSNLQGHYLWPRTPINDIQSKILQRVGASDYEVEVSYSRPALIIKLLRALIKKNLIPSDFSVLDIACGDAIILWQIKRAFPDSYCFGVDCNKGKISTHDMVQQDGVVLYNAFIQHLFQHDVDEPFDVVLMLNTYRGWESADLREDERNLPDLADAWFEKNTRYTILTATLSQIARLRKSGFAVQKMGKGEDNSIMVSLSKHKLPKSFLQYLIHRWLKQKFNGLVW
jgi:hypothetical protein